MNNSLKALLGLFFLLTTTSCTNQNNTPKIEQTKIQQIDTHVVVPIKKSNEITTVPIKNNLGKAYFLSGHIGDFPIEVYIWSRHQNADTTFISGLYWYTKHHKPLEVQGYILNKEQRLWFHRENKEFFDLVGFNGLQANGTWTHNDKKIPCALKEITKNTFDFDHSIKAMVEKDHFLTITNNSTVQVNTVEAKEDFEFEAIEIQAFDNWHFQFTEAFDAGQTVFTCYWQHLLAEKPTILYLRNGHTGGRDFLDDFNEDEMQPYIDYSIFDEAILLTLVDGKWQQKELLHLVSDIEEHYKGRAGHHVLKTSPNAIFLNKERWVWNGSVFNKK